MNMLDDSSFRDLCVGDIVVTSGIRPMGRTVSHVKMGRAKNGLLYIWRGKVTFWGVDKKTVTASDGALIFIPKGHRYKMQYTAENTTFVLVNCEMFNRNREFAIEAWNKRASCDTCAMYFPNDGCMAGLAEGKVAE